MPSTLAPTITPLSGQYKIGLQTCCFPWDATHWAFSALEEESSPLQEAWVAEGPTGQTVYKYSSYYGEVTCTVQRSAWNATQLACAKAEDKTIIAWLWLPALVPWESPDCSLFVYGIEAGGIGTPQLIASIDLAGEVRENWALVDITDVLDWGTLGTGAEVHSVEVYPGRYSAAASTPASIFLGCL